MNATLSAVMANPMLTAVLVGVAVLAVALVRRLAHFILFAVIEELVWHLIERSAGRADWLTVVGNSAMTWLHELVIWVRAVL